MLHLPHDDYQPTDSTTAKNMNLHTSRPLRWAVALAAFTCAASSGFGQAALSAAAADRGAGGGSRGIPLAATSGPA